MSELQNDSWPFRLLRSFCPPHMVEEIEGDLLQKFERDVKAFGARKAKGRLLWNVMRFCRPGILLRNRFSIGFNPIDMWMQQVKFSTRVLLKNKFFSTLNTLGLALGISVSIILLLILQSDLTYDQHYIRHKEIFRLGSHYQITGTDELLGVTARELGPILKEQYPEIESLTRLSRWGNTLVKVPGAREIAFYESRIAQTDSTYFELFNHDFIYGNASSSLRGAHQLILTSSTAKKYFGDTEPLGKTLEIKAELWTVTGVIEDLPGNTHYKFDLLLSGLPEIRETWDITMRDGKPISLLFWNPDVITYLLLPKNYNPQDFYRKFPKIYDLYFKESGETLHGKNTPILELLTDIHLHSEAQDGEPDGNFANLQAIVGLGMLIILLACINYMNLSTAKAVNRATEIAVKKIIGSSRRLLRLSALTESITLSLISLLLAVIIVYLVIDLSSFNQLIGRQLSLNLFENPFLIWSSVAIAVMVGLLSGLYPAYHLANIPALASLKGNFKNQKSSQLFRKGLITLQFSISIFVVVCTLFMRDQLKFVMNKDLGFDSDNVLVIPIRDSIAFNTQQVVKNSLLADSRIISVTGSADVMGMGVGGGVMFGEGEAGMKQYGGILALFVGDDYLKTMGLTLIKGRDFQLDRYTDTDGSYIVNESAAKLMGWGDDPLGKKMTFWGGENPGKVIGMVNDFNVNALYQGIDPMVIVKGHWHKGYMQIRLSGEDLPGAIQFAKEKWSAYNESPFDYFFLDQRFNEQYKADEVQNKLLSVLSFVCIFISLLGLIGLSAFMAVQRTKEIGIRKVLGARVFDIILMLSKSTLGLVVLASVLMIPASWWTITSWLESFVYRMPIDFSLYAFITLGSLIIVGSVIALQSSKTANTNPVQSLKYE